MPVALGGIGCREGPGGDPGLDDEASRGGEQQPAAGDAVDAGRAADPPDGRLGPAKQQASGQRDGQMVDDPRNGQKGSAVHVLTKKRAGRYRGAPQPHPTAPGNHWRARQ